MRTEKEIMELILSVAQNDERIRVVGMEGSRTNINVPKDIFQDYDISYLVTDMQSFIANPHWIDIFGERIIMQTPEAMSLFPPALGGWFSYLMLFKDGNRIDLKLIPVNEKDKYLSSEKLLKIWLDKDNLFPKPVIATDEDYHIKRPTAEHFADCCNEFWWVSTYVAKGLWRGELLYAIDHLNNYVRSSLLRMISWKVGIETNFSLSIGKNYKYLQKYVSDELWSKLLSTYATRNEEECWQSLFTQTELFRETARYVAERLNYRYAKQEDDNVTEYLLSVKAMPHIAK